MQNEHQPTAKKRKQPPTFQHLPEQQAKKLKKAWVEKTRLKSKWKAEKRKLHAEHPENESFIKDIYKQLGEGEEQEQEGGDKQSRNQESSEEWTGIGRDEPGSDQESQSDVEDAPAARPTAQSLWKNRERKGSSKQSKEEHRSKNKHPARQHKDHANSKGKQRAHESNREDDDNEEERPKTLRDLKREAYSPSSLHTFKSDPFHKRRGQQQRGRGRGAYGSGPGRGRGRGRGQPNMKLRMNVMLDQIKQNLGQS